MVSILTKEQSVTDYRTLQQAEGKPIPFAYLVTMKLLVSNKAFWGKVLIMNYKALTEEVTGICVFCKKQSPLEENIVSP